MTFDPFYDFETRGYLRNRFAERDLNLVKRLEHSSFLANVERAFENLSSVEKITYPDVLKTHQILFGDLYPWAGQDRLQTAPDLAISRGPVMFAHPEDISRAVDHALAKAQDPAVMQSHPGEIMGLLAFGHPFLDGNGRTIMVVHTELASRAGVNVAWESTKKSEYLVALTQEIANPGKGILDQFITPHVTTSILRSHAIERLSNLQGLGPVISKKELRPGEQQALDERKSVGDAELSGEDVKPASRKDEQDKKIADVLARGLERLKKDQQLDPDTGTNRTPPRGSGKGRGR